MENPFSYPRMNAKDFYNRTKLLDAMCVFPSIPNEVTTLCIITSSIKSFIPMFFKNNRKKVAISRLKRRRRRSFKQIACCVIVTSLPISVMLSISIRITSEAINFDRKESSAKLKTGMLLENVFKWATENGAIFGKIGIQQISGDLYSLVATNDIEEGDVIGIVPFNISMNAGSLHERKRSSVATDNEIRGAGDVNPFSQEFCDVVDAVYYAITKSSQEMTPYEKYLASLKHDYHPITWSPDAKKLLKSLNGGDDQALFDLDSIFSMGQMAMSCGYEIDFTKNSKERDAFMLALVRSEEAYHLALFPIVDIPNHRAGGWVNIDSDTSSPHHVKYIATRDIVKGQEIIYSYNQCSYCIPDSNPERKSDLFSSFLFSIYGFVEELPQRWTSPSSDLMIDVVQNELNGPIQAILNREPTQDDKIFLQRHLKRFKMMEREVMKPTQKLRKVEHEVLRKFFTQVKRALTLALKEYYL